MPDSRSRRFRARLRRLLGPVQPLEQVRPLIACPQCRARVVVPVDWSEADEEHWWMALRCGECGAEREVIATDEEARRFGCELDAGVALLAAELVRLERERLRRDARALAQALDRDLIDAADFER